MSKVIGIIAEYNPFHNGHLYHLQKSLQLTHSSYSVAVISGNFTQRGSTSLIDKWAKAEIAIKNGIDLVLELPLLYSISSAENFAEGAIKLLDSLKVIDYLSFGSESGDISTLNMIADVLIKEPKAEPYFYRYMGSREFINNIERWFLLINRIPPHLLIKMPAVLQKLEEIKAYRLSSKSAPTRKLADTPAKFHFENMPENDYLVIPQTSSGRRRYIPIGFLTADVLVNNKLQVMREIKC